MLLQIVPSLPPAVSGVGDFATVLARELQTRHGVESRFLVGDPTWTPPGACPEFLARSIPARTAPALRALLAEESPATILLHYVPYGYATRGCPFWLIDALERWDMSSTPAPRPRLLTIFHELSADGEPVWRSAFWLAPFQRRLGRRLGRISRVRRMTTSLVADQLRALLPPDDNAVETVPVLSNLGESDAPLPIDQRERRMIVFGTRTWREEAYGPHRESLLASCRHLGIESILDVGSPLASPPTDLPVPFSAHGLIHEKDGPEVFGRSLAGFFTYPVPWLGKSSIFSGYCAHGLVPVTVPGNTQSSPEGLVAGTHYLLDNQGNDPADISRAAHAWYWQHRGAVHADGVYQAITADEL